ncbi:dTMP kinase [Candidatus Phytoplasma pini]|uniref:Thymidylate kinase n=1 Tax=Candidatus Phytoplasma pini TaxID=267362 RepID=A0A559KJQ9_9MOLU|nr:dTMP kinase [Candidatus Phytoplasma pini]TVY12328.1 thymidylate kinase [Candidatus Phytoplasma pini]
MFISFEGCEGTGKTTLSNFLFHKIISKYPVILTKEPGDDYVFNSKIRNILISFYNKIDDQTEALLYAANRIEHLKKVILPALEKKKIVICDRYIDSSIAYQAYGRNLGENFIKNINIFSLKNLPSLTFYLDLEPSIGIQRIKTYRKNKMEYFDFQNMDFHNRVREGYLSLCKRYSKRIYKLDASLPLEQIKLIIISRIKKCFSINI